MTKPTLVVMAAGMGSRYGGLKQIEPIGPGGECIIDYSAYDAMQAGFGRVIFVIAPAMEDTFRQVAGDRIHRALTVGYVEQRMDCLPEGFAPPPERLKPWGTAHALYCCRGVVAEPFAVINADDFYGRDAFVQVARFLRDTGENGPVSHYCMAGYKVENTLTENGRVSRGVCGLSPEGFLTHIHERFEIGRADDGAIAAQTEKNGGERITIPEGSVVSMNMWGFTPDFLESLEEGMADFLSTPGAAQGEFYLPAAVERLLREGRADVQVLPTAARWYGMTYRDDKDALKDAVRGMVEDGLYPRRLWGEGE